MLKQSQVKYALERLDQIYRNQQVAIQNDARDQILKSGSTPSYITMTEFVALIKKGKLRPLKAENKIGYTDPQYPHSFHGDDLKYAFNFSEVIKRPDDHRVAINAKSAERIRALNVEFDRVRDQLMLGDAAEALKLITAFTKMKF